ncbi:PLP-dependent aminotransferase family protein [Streptomyces sp. NPDC029044]|uniref:aminotransferase-like domain-containing protein n=1 Tax=Streptomyces sp. NPDC029044 TaxID=3157198 RepID=UPI0033F875B1
MPTTTSLRPLALGELHSSLSDPALTSMTLLNEIAGRFPAAVSFAAGRPYEGFHEPESLQRQIAVFRTHLEAELGQGPEQVRRTLFQYGRTKGTITHLVARHLETDEGLRVDPESLVVTTGCQEAMVLVLRALRRDERDVVLAPAPTYVGFIGAARLVDMPVRPVLEGPEGVDPEDLIRQIRAARAEGLRPRACYVVPDFANPGGASMPPERRRQVLRIAEEEGILLLEDNPYSLFRASGSRPPTIKSMDEHRRVVYLGSFAKSAFAGARVGYVVADQPVADGSGAGMLADELAKLKSMLTLNTSTVAQAVIGGFLLENGCSVQRAVTREAAIYRENLRAVLTGLAARFPGSSAVERGGVDWNAPSGGMFVVLTVPFRADEEALEVSAERFGVLWTPMHHFYAGAGGFRQMRLSFSVLTPSAINEGLDRLAAFVAHRS